MSRSTVAAVVVAIVALGGVVAARLFDTGASESTADVSATADASITSDATTPTSAPSTAAPSTVGGSVGEAPPVLRPAPDLVDLDGWIQTDRPELLAAPAGIAISDVDAPVKVVQFWTFSCINCKRTLANLGELYANHRHDGLEVLGVHAPEFGFEEDPAAVAEAAAELNVTWPIALDTRKRNFRSWQEGRRFWPRTYVIDADNNIRFDHIGEGKYDELNQTVAWLLANGGA